MELENQFSAGTSIIRLGAGRLSQDDGGRKTVQARMQGDMASSTALPLSQQVLAWTLQAMGLLDDLSKVSKSTVKNALRGEVIWQAWDGLTEETVRAFGLSLDDAQRAQFRAGLRELDGKFAKLDDLGLPAEDLLPPVLRMLIPQLGVRLGALAAMIDGGLWAGARAVCPKLAEWVCDPLSPVVFGRVVEGLLVAFKPEWDTWSERKEQLADRGIASKRTVERWRSPSVVDVPNVGNVLALGELMGGADEQRLATLLLRVGRLVMVMRQALARWLGDTQADGVEAALRSWAAMTRRALTSAEFVGELGELLGAGLAENAEHGLAFFEQRRPLWGGLLDGVEPGDIGALLQREGAALRRGEGGAILRGLVFDQLVLPNPVVIAAVGSQLGAENMLLAATVDPAEAIQGQWRLAHSIGLVASGTAFAWQMGPEAEVRLRNPSPALQGRARRIQAHLRAVVRRSDEDPLDQIEFLRFWFAFAAESGGLEAVQQMSSAWNEAVKFQQVPPALEPLLGDDDLRDLPHLAPLRAARLAEAGEDRAAVEWLGQWKKGSILKSGVERRAAAATTLTLAHRCLDRVVGLVPFLQLRETAAVDGAGVLVEAVETVQGATRKALGLADALLGLAQRLFRDTEKAQCLDELFVLAVRGDWIASELAGADDIEPVRSAPIAEELARVLELHATQPECWAALALWQELVGDDQAFALRQAKHFGGEAAYLRMRARLASDGVLAPR